MHRASIKQTSYKQLFNMRLICRIRVCNFTFCYDHSYTVRLKWNSAVESTVSLINTQLYSLYCCSLHTHHLFLVWLQILCPCKVDLNLLLRFHDESEIHNGVFGLKLNHTWSDWNNSYCHSVRICHLWESYLNVSFERRCHSRKIEF